MKRVLIAVVGLGVVALFAGVAFAQMGWGHMGPGMGWGPGVMGSGWQGGGPGWYGCPGMAWSGQPGAAAAQVTEEQAKQAAQQYADRYLNGFAVDKVLPFTGMGGMTMYSVEVKGPNDEIRTLHVNPWGNVMPFAGPWRRSG